MTALQQNTQEWLDFRKNKIGSSDAPIIMKASPWKAPYELWQEKLGIKEIPIENAFMRRGKDLEMEARQEFEKKTKTIVWPDVLVHPKYDFLIASLDGISPDKSIAVEIKCPGAKTHNMALEGKIPEHYNIQMQHQLMVTGLENMYYFSYDGKDDVVIEVKRDDVLIEEILEKEKAFYECMINYISPINEKNDPIWQQYSSKWIEIQNKKKAIEIEEKQCRNMLIDLSGNETVQGCGLKLTKYIRKGRIAYHKIPQIKGVDLELFREKNIEAWRISEI